MAFMAGRGLLVAAALALAALALGRGLVGLALGAAALALFTWQFGQDHVSHWHEIHSPGLQTIDTLPIEEFLAAR